MAVNSSSSAADSVDQAEFEYEFALACNVMLGKSFAEAEAEAVVWIQEAAETQPVPTVRRVRRVTSEGL